jgi:hypothetical protein
MSDFDCSRVGERCLQAFRAANRVAGAMPQQHMQLPSGLEFGADVKPTLCHRGTIQSGQICAHSLWAGWWLRCCCPRSWPWFPRLRPVLPQTCCRFQNCSFARSWAIWPMASATNFPAANADMTVRAVCPHSQGLPPCRPMRWPCCLQPTGAYKSRFWLNSHCAAWQASRIILQQPARHPASSQSET